MQQKKISNGVTNCGNSDKKVLSDETTQVQQCSLMQDIFRKFMMNRINNVNLYEVMLSYLEKSLLNVILEVKLPGDFPKGLDAYGHLSLPSRPQDQGFIHRSRRLIRLQKRALLVQNNEFINRSPESEACTCIGISPSRSGPKKRLVLLSGSYCVCLKNKRN